MAQIEILFINISSFSQPAECRIDFSNAQNITTGNINQAAAKAIIDSREKVAQSDAARDLKDRLTELSQAVAEMAKALPENQQEQVARDLKSLTDEATSDSPRKSWYELSAKGLIEAAKIVGEIAEPVITATKAVLTLLAS
ncbi:MAG: hypothetical protein QNJ55_27625 [Xenococcus sp. MO_188.B8]|nr:hypothetical protein [Xenococcus sp. MO_188.B8]